MLDWIPTLLAKIFCFVPRFEKVPATHRAVKWRGSGDATFHGPGRVWWWPLITDIESHDIRWQPTLTSVQTVQSLDGRTVSLRVLVRWRVEDLLLAVAEEQDYADSVADIAQAVAVDTVGVCPMEILECPEKLNDLVCQSLIDELSEIGLQVKYAKVSEFCFSPAIRIINDA